MPPLEAEVSRSKIESLNDLKSVIDLPTQIAEKAENYRNRAIVAGSVPEARQKYWQATGGLMPGWEKIEKRFATSGAIAHKGDARIVLVNSSLNPAPHTEFVVTHEAVELALQEETRYCVEILKILSLFGLASDVPSGSRPLYPHYVALLHEYVQAASVGKLRQHHLTYDGKDLDESGRRYRDAVYSLVVSLTENGK